MSASTCSTLYAVVELNSEPGLVTALQYIGAVMEYR